MFDSVIKLIAETKTINEYGDKVVTTSERSVFADLRSIGQSEFYQAQAVGLKPEIKFVLPDYLEYNGEKTLKFQDFNESEETTYEVLRTYREGNLLELVCYKGLET